MLQLRDTRIFRTQHAKVENGILIAEEGIALIYTKTGGDGDTVVAPAAGGDETAFAGVSYERFTPPGVYPFISDYAVPAGLTVELPRTPIAGKLLVKNADTGVAYTIVTTTPDADTKVEITGDTLTFNAGLDPLPNITVQFLYAPSVLEARLYTGDAPIGGLPSHSLDVIGRILQGDISTTFYDASKDWSAVLTVGLGAGGYFVPSTSGHVIPGVIVKNTPNASNPFLILGLNVA
jgi:hypothetical protein